VFALRSAQKGALPLRPASSGSAFLRERFVLPRWLRRPARLALRLGRGDFEPPRFAATWCTGVLFALTGLYGSYVAGTLPEVMQGVTARTGFAVEQVRVVGHRETSEIDVLDRLGLDGWPSLVGFSAQHARDAISGLPWVKSATVRKVYPSTLEIRLEERQAFAVWQRGSTLSVIGEKGNVIAPFRGGHHSALPLVVGAGAAEVASGFVAMVHDYPSIASRVKGYVRVGGRRWDLRLDNGVTVRLPAADQEAALSRLVALDRQGGLLGKDIVSVDLRIEDRVVVKLTPEAAEARQAELEKRGKALKKAGRKA